MRSVMIARSNSAKTPSISNSARPAGVVVSTAWRSRYKSHPTPFSSPRKPTRSCNERPRRSTDQGRDDIDLALCRRFEQPVKPWPFVTAFGAADAVVDEFHGDLPAAVRGCRGERLALVLDCRLAGADPEIETDPLAVHRLCSLCENNTVCV